MTWDPADVRRRRLALGLGQRSLADSAGCKLRAVVHVEGGPGSSDSPDADRIIAMLTELEADPPRLPKGLEGDHPRRWMTLP